MKNRVFFWFWLGNNMMKVKEIYMKGEGVNKWENGSANKTGKPKL